MNHRIQPIRNLNNFATDWTTINKRIPAHMEDLEKKKEKVSPREILPKSYKIIIADSSNQVINLKPKFNYI